LNMPRISYQLRLSIITKAKVNVKFTIEQATKAQRGSGGITLLLL